MWGLKSVKHLLHRHEVLNSHPSTHGRWLGMVVQVCNLQHWRSRDTGIPGAHWPASLAWWGASGQWESLSENPRCTAPKNWQARLSFGLHMHTVCTRARAHIHTHTHTQGFPAVCQGLDYDKRKYNHLAPVSRQLRKIQAGPKISWELGNKTIPCRKCTLHQKTYNPLVQSQILTNHSNSIYKELTTVSIFSTRESHSLFWLP